MAPTFASASQCSSAVTPDAKRSDPVSARWKELLTPIRRSQEFVAYGAASRLHNYIDTLASQRAGKLVVTSIGGASIRRLHQVIYEYKHVFVEILKPSNIETSSEPVSFVTASEEEARDFIRYKQKVEGHGSYVGKLGGDHQLLYARLLEVLNFVLNQYKDRKHWPASFLRSLVKVAIQYVDHSTFIIVREKTTDGKPGRIIGTGRTIQVPYVSLPALRRARGDYFTPDQDLVNMTLRHEGGNALKSWDLPIDRNPFLKFSGAYSKEWNRELWMEIFGGPVMNLRAADLSVPEARFMTDLAYIPAPMEVIFNRNYVEQRPSPTAELQFFNEPGNLAVLQDRELRPELQKIAPLALYFHAARLSRKESGLGGDTTMVGTYASQNGSSDRFYQYLGFKLHEVLNAEGENESGANTNPTREAWNVLVEDNMIFEKVLQRRFGAGTMDGSLRDAFQSFDSFEAGVKDDSRTFDLSLVKLLSQPSKRIFDSYRQNKSEGSWPR